MTIKLTSILQCDDPDSLANNTKRTLNVNAPLFTPQTTMGNGGNILDQVRIVSNLCIWYSDKGQKIHDFFFLAPILKKLTKKLSQFFPKPLKWVESKKNAH